MNSVERTLVDAYRREEVIYNSILEMVKKQKELLSNQSSGPMAPLLDICADIEEELSKISSIESEIEEEKREWMESHDELPSFLEEVLDRIQETIDETRALQEQMSTTLAEQRQMNPNSGGQGQHAGDVPGARKAQNAYSNV
jgi:hypothetical protein